MNVAIRPQEPSRRWEKNRCGSAAVQYSPPWTAVTPAAASHIRASPYRSACHRPRSLVRKQAADSASSAVNASRTSSPTSNESCEIAGPSHAIRLLGAADISSSVAATTPPARPRHPACTAAISSPSVEHNRIGTQSAVMTAQLSPMPRPIAASAFGGPTSTSLAPARTT